MRHGIATLLACLALTSAAIPSLLHQDPRYYYRGDGSVASRAYDPSSGRTVSATLSRWGSQLLCDALANELKEFWPDVHQHLSHH